MKIAVDAMGGDFAPVEVVKGAVAVAAEAHDVEIVLVGDEAVVAAELAAQGAHSGNISIRHASQVIAMDEHPAQAVRRKRDSSLVLAALMVKSGEADATFSAGNTGATMATAALDIGRIPGIERPAIATLLPTIDGDALVLDVGANPDATPHNLLQYALLGALYAEKVLGRPHPSIGLLNIGTEPGKGNELTKATYALLEASPLDFHGNVEPRDVFEHRVEVVICDGFVGNVLLKCTESMGEMLMALIDRELLVDPAMAEKFAPMQRRVAARVDYAETGGAPLLGIDGVSIIGHGRSHARAIVSGIRAARAAAAAGIIAAIHDALPGLKAVEQMVLKGDAA
jgi:glycerol-3-phosphate acyltransferase PlsX